MIKNFYLASALILASAVVSGGVATPSAPQGEQPEFKINTTIEEDLSSFGFSPEEKYSSILDENLTESPVVLVNFYLNESKNNVYYFYGDINEVKDINLILKYQDVEDSIIPKLYFVDYDENLKISRFVDNNDKPEQLKFDDLVNVSIDYLITDDDNVMSSFRNSEYQFNFNNNDARANDASIERKYNQPIQIKLNDPHVWSYNFDQDSTASNFWEEFKSLFGFEGDTLDNQIFYSFVLPSGWEEWEISSIDISYYKTLLLANSYNILSNLDDFNYFDQWSLHSSSGYLNNPDPRATYWSWSEDFNNPDFDFTNDYLLSNYLENYLGGTLDQAKAKFESEITDGKLKATEINISADEMSETNIGNTKFEWKKIQTADSFNSAFSQNQEIIDFAKEFMPSNDYYVINFDNFIYKFSNAVFSYSTVESMEDLSSPDYLNFYNYLKNNNAEQTQGDPWEIGGGYYNGYKYYKNIVEMPLNVEAKSLTLVNSNGEEITADVVVKPVDLEDIGGDPEKPITDFLKWWENLKNSIVNFFSSPQGWLITIGVVAGVIILIVIISAIVKAIQNDESKK